MFIDLNIN